MYDIKNRRPFLKRSEFGTVGKEDLFVGATITVYSRKLRITDYADVFTRKHLQSKKSRTLCMIKPDGYSSIGRIIDSIYKLDLTINNACMVRMPFEDAEKFAYIIGVSNIKETAVHLSSDVCILMEVVGEYCINKMITLVGPTDPQEAREYHPDSLRAHIGQDTLRNSVHVSGDHAAARVELEFAFTPKGNNPRWETTAVFNNCSCCIIRPHAIRNSGLIIERILSEGFEISALGTFNLDRAMAEEFLDVYRSVLPELQSMCAHMSSGVSLVLEIRQKDAVTSFRELVGPHDPEVAKHLRPDTIRAKYGIDRVRNAVHCTDLPDDGLLETEYFFKILHTRIDPLAAN
eukprot:GHVR01105845.1.p1 GENE.GHVR01105845.1~~GHVR01105845.1.p1  ORF type:complete len:378 (+),score=52.88 GHVR01105845.1:95-1135(+)